MNFDIPDREVLKFLVLCHLTHMSYTDTELTKLIIQNLSGKHWIELWYNDYSNIPTLFNSIKEPVEDILVELSNNNEIYFKDGRWNLNKI